MVLNEQTLTNLSLAVSNLMSFSETAMQAAQGVNTLFETNSSPINAAMSNLVVFSSQLNDLAEELNQTVLTNRESLTRAMNNLEKSSHSLQEILADVNAGSGVAGSLIRDENLKVEMSALVTNFNVVAGNLGTLSSNINTRGLWSVLWKPKPEKRR